MLFYFYTLIFPIDTNSLFSLFQLDASQLELGMSMFSQKKKKKLAKAVGEKGEW